MHSTDVQAGERHVAAIAKHETVLRPGGDLAAIVGGITVKDVRTDGNVAATDGAEIVLHHCPFATAALEDRDTVCALHLGIAEGLVEGTPGTVDELVAYDPRMADCRLRVRVADDTEADSSTGTLSLRGRRRGR